MLQCFLYDTRSMRNISRLIISFSILLLVFVSFFHKTTELSLDLGEHLVFGKLTLTQHFFPKTNIFSYTYPNAPFIHHEFLPDVLFYLLYTYWGINSLIIFTTLVVTGAFALLFVYSYRRAHPLVLFTASLLYVRMLFERTYVRPEIFSYAFLAVFTVILLTYRRRFTRWIFLLIPLQFLWVNSHIYFIFGIFLTACVLGEMLINQSFRKDNKQFATLFFVLCGQILVSFINPNGISGALYPFTVFSNYGYSIAENNSIFVIEQLFAGTIVYSILFFKLAAICLFISLPFVFKKTYLYEWIVSVTLIILATMQIRNFPLFIFGTFPLFITAVDRSGSFVFKKTLNKWNTRKTFLPVFLEIMFLVIFVIHIPYVWTAGNGGLGTNDAAENGVNFFITNHLSGPIFNNYGIGSYLVFRLFPKERVFVDGRPEAYPASFFTQTYVPLQTNPNLFEKVSKKYHFNTIIFDYPAEQTHAAQLFLNNISTNPAWKMVYLDDTLVIFVKNTHQNKSVVKHYEVSEYSFVLKNNMLNEYSLENLVYFFQIVGWKLQEDTAYKQLLKINPNNCVALLYEIHSLSAKNDQGSIVLQNRYEQQCSQ